MFTFLILLAIAIILIVITIAGIIAGGVAFILVFGDVIVCIALICMILRWILKRKGVL